jgi:hypothetical protein
LSGERVHHELRRLARLDAPHPGIFAGLLIREGGRDRARRFLAELVTADAGAVLDDRQPVLLRDVGRDAVLAAELFLVRDRQ